MIIALCSTDIFWENKELNFQRLDFFLEALDFDPDVIILPEMFATGFTMDVSYAESMEGETVRFLRKKTERTGAAFIASAPIREGGRLFNRALFVEPEGKVSHYDKRHLFRMGTENRYYAAGKEKCIVPYKGVRFSLNVCYDLRFPVWSRNICNEYDVLVNVANFPASRVSVIEPLVRARAIENQAYCLFVNRVGRDDLARYELSSFAADYLGNACGERVLLPRAEKVMPGSGILKVVIDMEKLVRFREKFPVWEDADRFTLNDSGQMS